MTNKKMQTTEQYVRRYLAPFTFVGLLSSIVIIFLSIRDLISDGRSYYIHDFVDGLIVTAVFFMSICLSLWFYKNDIKRYLITKGEKFNAKIIAFNKGIGRGNGANIHFVIQFVENGKKMKFYSQGYNVNPLKDLVEAKWYIYKKIINILIQVIIYVTIINIMRYLYMKIQKIFVESIGEKIEVLLIDLNYT